MLRACVPSGVLTLSNDRSLLVLRVRPKRISLVLPLLPTLDLVQRRIQIVEVGMVIFCSKPLVDFLDMPGWHRGVSGGDLDSFFQIPTVLRLLLLLVFILENNLLSQII